MTDVNFSFTSPTPAKVESRAAIPTLDEYKVHNLYVYVFDKAGKMVNYSNLTMTS